MSTLHKHAAIYTHFLPCEHSCTTLSTHNSQAQDIQRRQKKSIVLKIEESRGIRRKICPSGEGGRYKQSYTDNIKEIPYQHYDPNGVICEQ